MRYLAALLVAAGLLLLMPAASEAGHRHWGHHHHFGHHHHHFGHRHFGGFGAYRSWGGYRPWGGVNISVGFGGYRPYYGFGGYGQYYGYGGYLHSAFYRPYIYSSYYRPYWSYQYDYLQPYYYYQTPIYYGYPSYYHGYPAYGYFGSAPAVNINRVIIVKRDAVKPAAAAELDTVVAKTRIDLVSRSRQLLRLGDEAFREGRYLTALTRYRTAAETAPREPEPHFRKGHAYLANGQYDLAAASFRKALQLEPSAHRDGFKLDDLYGKGSVAKGVHIENLAALALMHEEAPEGYFLLGLMLHFGGEKDRAEKFFARAAMLSRDTRDAVAGFLPEADREKPVSVATTDEI